MPPPPPILPSRSAWHQGDLTHEREVVAGQRGIALGEEEKEEENEEKEEAGWK